MPHKSDHQSGTARLARTRRSATSTLMMTGRLVMGICVGGPRTEMLGTYWRGAPVRVRNLQRGPLRILGERHEVDRAPPWRRVARGYALRSGTAARGSAEPCNVRWDRHAGREIWTASSRRPFRRGPRAMRVLPHLPGVRRPAGLSRGRGVGNLSEPRDVAAKGYEGGLASGFRFSPRGGYKPKPCLSAF
jgi:hypothetical protein